VLVPGVVLDVVPVVPSVAVVGDVPGEASSSPPESTSATITPPSAAAATTAASRGFFTGSEATLARPWPHMSKSS
jgi:hypothetical protein